VYILAVTVEAWCCTGKPNC